MLMKLLIMSNALVLIAAQTDRDWSFQAMCNFYNKKSYRPRTGGFNAMKGDTCDFQFQVTTDAESAGRYCEENVPYHINSVKSGFPTVCSAEATLICRSGWVQFFGRCYKITKKMMTRDEAETHCQGMKTEVGGANVDIAFMHREALPFRINDYFTHVSSIWLDASEAIAKDLIHDFEGGNLLLALDGYKFHLPNVAIARVDPFDKAMALCEYTPEMNRAESNYLLKRYGEIYFPTIVTSEGSFVRTTSSLNRNEDDPLADSKYCTKVMKPFIPNGKSRSAVPTQEFLDEVNNGQSGVIIRTSAFSMKAKKEERQSKKCQSHRNGIVYHIFSESPIKIHFFNYTLRVDATKIDHSVWRPNEPKGVCDAGSWSSALVTGRGGDAGLESMSDARYAPIYCQSVVQTYVYGDCESGYFPYYREHLGQKWCHRLVYDDLTFDEAEKNCQKQGAHLTGYTSDEEYRLLNSKQRYRSVWIGAKRQERCSKHASKDDPGWSANKDDPCSRGRVFLWLNNVAPNPPHFPDDHWMTPTEPNNIQLKEHCLTFMYGKLNDNTCDGPYPSFCGKEAPIILKS